jgi:hypothetical protein
LTRHFSKVIITVFLIVLTGSSYSAEAKDAQIKDNLDSAKLKAVQELLASTGAAANSNQFTAAFSQQLISVLRIANPSLSQTAVDIVNEEVEKIVADSFSNDALQKEIYPLYTKHFTLSELKDLVAFNRSPVGVKANAIMPQLMQESLAAAHLWSQEIGPVISTQVLKRFNEEGIEIRVKPQTQE